MDNSIYRRSCLKISVLSSLIVLALLAAMVWLFGLTLAEGTVFFLMWFTMLATFLVFVRWQTKKPKNVDVAFLENSRPMCPIDVYFEHHLDSHQCGRFRWQITNQARVAQRQKAGRIYRRF